MTHHNAIPFIVAVTACAASPTYVTGPGVPPAAPASMVDASAPFIPPVTPPAPVAPSCVASGPEVCGNALDDDCNPTTSDVCVAHNCAQVRALGIGTVDGVYMIHPPGVVEPFPVFCDMTTHGGGWALAMNAPSGGYGSLPEVSAPLLMGTHGQLSVERIARLLTVPSTTENNVRVETRSPNHVVSLRAVLDLPLPDLGTAGTESSGIRDPDAPPEPVVPPMPAEPFVYTKYVFRVPWNANGNCDAFDPGPDVAEANPNEHWMFANGSDGGGLGFSESTSRNGDYGYFYTNYDTQVDKACNRQRTDGAWRPGLAGSLWIR